MKKIVIICISLFSFANLANAHPGRTDSNGGHYCRTNCTKWGLKYGEYHYHNKKTEKKELPEAKTTAKQEARSSY